MNVHELEWIDAMYLTMVLRTKPDHGMISPGVVEQLGPLHEQLFRRPGSRVIGQVCKIDH